MTHWLEAIYLMCSSKKGISTRQLQRMLGGSMKTAWFMGHRIREAMKDGGNMICGPGKAVEADETYLSNSPKTRKPAGTALHAKPAPMVFALVERGGNVRSMYLDHRNVRTAIRSHLDRYLAEFDCRTNTRAKLGINDAQRTGIAVAGAAGKRLMYKTAH